MTGMETHETLNYYVTIDEKEQAEFRKWLRDHLHYGPVKVTFIKSDGTERTMNCTLEEGVAIPHEKTTDRVKEVSSDVCPVWDIDKGAWRSFRYDAIKTITFEIPID